MNLKKYNEQTKTWDIIASGNASGVAVTDPHFVSSGVQKSVNDTLVEIDNKIEQLKRNLSWVVQNGTIGGGGGGEGGIDAQIKLTNSNIQVIDGVNYLYATKKSVTLNYIIQQNRSGQKYYLSATLDGNMIVNGQVAYSQTAGTIEIHNIAQFSDNANHSIIIVAENENGIALEPYVLRIVESSINLTSEVSSNVATIGLAYNIQYIVTNRVLGSDTQLIVRIKELGASSEKIYDVGKFSSSDPKTINVNFFDLFGGQTPSTGSSYTIIAEAATTVDGQTIKSDPVTNNVVVEDGETLVVLVDGITTEDSEGEKTQFSQSGNISFTFTPYLAGVNVIYYALQIRRGSNITTVGIFDADLTNFDKNQYTQRGIAKVFSWAIPSGSEWVGDYEITLRCWSDKGAPVKDTILVCNVTESDQSLYDTQNPNNTLYASWNIKQASFSELLPTSSQWVSNISNFYYPGDLTATPISTDLNVYNTNGSLSGFFTEEGQSKLRLVGESYGVIDFTPFANNPDDAATGIYNWGKRGFTFSVTFKTDLHPFNNGSVFSIADYFDDGTLEQGIHVGLEDVIWKYVDAGITYTVSCKIQQNVVTALDFVVDQDNKELKIFVNGVLNVAREITSDFRWYSQSKMYLACSNVNNIIKDFSDVEFYEMNMFMAPLNDFQVVINSMNSRARASLLSSGSIDFAQYNTWKQNNFFTASGANSLLWDNANGEYANLYFNDLINQGVHIPVVFVNCSGSGFTKDVYEKINADTGIWYEGCSMQYYEPSNKTTVSTDDVSIAIQGTSSTGYRSKNVDIRFNKGRDSGKPELFRPKASWFPENQFTLKADVVDSAHANNASIGAWINKNANDLFEPTPPMAALEANRPINSGSSDREDKVIHEVTIKHTLEGFPIIFLIQFDESSSQEMLGIYSFNLGRAAYYNMGMKFLKSFTHDIFNADNTVTMVDKIPAFVTKYEEYGVSEPFGDIVQSQIYSYEFGQNANVIVDKTTGEVQPTALFMQDDLSVIQHVGEFKFNGASPLVPEAAVTDTNIWNQLKQLFTILASMVGESTDKYYWDTISGGYIQTGERYPAGDWGALSAALSQQLSIKNAYSYFMICVIFGLVDSLGKNMTLRSWNVGNGNKWWPCFYDLDTANGLSNTGEENVAKTAYIDSFSNSIVESGINTLNITYNSSTGGYDTYSSRLWDVLRDQRFIGTGSNDEHTYEEVWRRFRTNSNIMGTNSITGLTGAQQFINNYFSAQTAGCGELLYNYDYRVKYLTKYYTQSFIGGQWVTSDKATYGNVQFLHGTRENYVRDWLSKRMLFMDGVFKYSDPSITYAYNNIGAFSCGGSEQANGELIVRTNSPVIMNITIDTTRTYQYFVPENADTSLFVASLSAPNTQIALNNISEISKIGGLKDMRFEKFMESMKLPSMSELDLSDVTTLTSNPVVFENIFRKPDGVDADGNVKYNSDIRHINLANAKFLEENSSNDFPVVISDFKKLKTLDISNSSVKSISLPNAALTELTVHDSQIERISLIDQPFIDHVDFSGCNKLSELTISNCDKITELDLRNMPNLTTVTITGCDALISVNLSGCAKLVTCTISATPVLTSLDLSNCTNANLDINLAVSSLTSLNLANTNTSKVIKFPQVFNKLTSLNLYSSNIHAFQFGTQSIATYKGEQVLDLSAFNFSSLDIRYNTSKYIKFKNSKSNPFTINSNTFIGCTALTRVFGHFKATGSALFFNSSGGKLSNFTIHERSNTEVPVRGTWYGPDTDVDTTSWDNNSDLQTNITFATTSLSSAFRGTACNMFDVYYVLQMCDNVKTLDNIFYECRQVVTDINNPLRRDTFSHCTNVTSASHAFYNSGISGPLYSVTHSGNNVTAYNGLLSPLKKLVNANGLFYTSKTFYIDDMFFYKCAANQELVIENISNMFSWNLGDNVQIVDNCNESLSSSNVGTRQSYARASMLLRHLPNLKTLYDVLNNIRMNFDTETIAINGTTLTFCPLIAYNPNLTSIRGCFYNVKASGNLNYLFGGNEAFVNAKFNTADGRELLMFPRSLATIDCFLVVTSNNGTKVLYPVHNSMFRLIRNSLVHMRHWSTSGAADYAHVTLNGAGLNKKFVPEEDEQFPFDIFKSCTKLQTCPYFFYGLTSDKDYSTSDLRLPGDMFINNTVLKDIDGCFMKMTSNIRYTLTSKGFINCQLTSVRNCFNDDGNLNKKGGIPYGLFYQEKKTTKTFEGFSRADAEALGLTEESLYPNQSSAPAVKKYTEKLTVRNNTIQAMTGVLRNFNSSDATCYEREDYLMTSFDDIGDVIIFNESYDPREYILNPDYDVRETIVNPDWTEGSDLPQYIENPDYNAQYVIKNPAYDPYHYSWNIWYLDGTDGFNEIVTGSEFYQKVLDGTINDISSTLPAEFSDPDNAKTNPSPAGTPRSESMNYICSPDLFRYCVNSTSTRLDYALGNVSVYTVGPNVRTNQGIYGRVPKYLFKPLTNIQNLHYVFYQNLNITPYTWHDEQSNGNMLHPDTFRSNTQLINITGIFAGIHVPSKIVIPTTLLSGNTRLQNVSYLFYGAIFYGSNEEQQLPNELFSSNKLLTNISYMFAAFHTNGPSTNNNVKNIGNGSLFTQANHTRITNVTSFMQYQGNTYGTVPEMWRWLKPTAANRANVFYGVSKSKITNSDAIVAAGWDTGMIN